MPSKLKTINIKNFRLLHDVSVDLEDVTTVIVGRNNSGKTSLTELFHLLLPDTSSSLELEDYSIQSQRQFWEAFVLYKGEASDSEVLALLPSIRVELIVEYDAEDHDLGFLTPFIVDLDPECTFAKILIEHHYKGGDPSTLFEDIDYDPATPKKSQFYARLREILRRHYTLSLRAVDPNDASNETNMDFTALYSLLNCDFISAYRHLGEDSGKERNVLGLILENLFTSALVTDETGEQDRAREIEEAVAAVRDNLDEEISDKLSELLPAFQMFGYPNLRDPNLVTETILDAQKLLRNHTRVAYQGVDGLNLPESYNGLGFRNLIYILFRLFEFFREYQAKEARPSLQVIFIEEPEAHLHPQMQEVFVAKLNEIAREFATRYNNEESWPVQFVLTTHSPHVANRTDFNTIRYFLSDWTDPTQRDRHTIVKNLREGLGDADDEDRDFLHKYLTLTRCDLFFADKAILIEGTSERLLLPRIIEKIESTLDPDQQLSSQYIAIIEVGGAYAHVFFNLLDFLDLPTLIITDIDSVETSPDTGRRVGGLVSESSFTSNSTIKRWFDNKDISPAELIDKSEADRTDELRLLTYQVPETADGPCGRSLEEAFILANRDLFDLDDEEADALEERASSIAGVEKKTEFALRYAIDEPDWVCPRYIAEGLTWLAGHSSPEIIEVDDLTAEINDE